MKKKMRNMIQMGEKNLKFVGTMKEFLFFSTLEIQSLQIFFCPHFLPLKNKFRFLSFELKLTAH
jgi:hypothetical protein